MRAIFTPERDYKSQTNKSGASLRPDHRKISQNCLSYVLLYALIG